MTRHWLGLPIATLACSLAIAGADASWTDWNAAYPEKTAVLGLHGDAGRGAEAFVICQGCHRVGALGRTDGSYPRLAGQHASVLIKQLTDVRTGRRTNPKMLPFADHQVISIQEIADIAAYLQALPVPATQGQGAGNDLARGARLYQADCAVCHGARGEGNADKFYPRVSGQHFRYLLRENRLIRDNKRHNANPEMIGVIKNYTDDDIAAVADFMSRLPVEMVKQVP